MINTIKDNIIISAKTISDLYTWIDAVYSMYNNISGHTGGKISIRYVIIHEKPLKQKINVKTST